MSGIHRFLRPSCNRAARGSKPGAPGAVRCQTGHVEHLAKQVEAAGSAGLLVRINAEQGQGAGRLHRQRPIIFPGWLILGLCMEHHLSCCCMTRPARRVPHCRASCSAAACAGLRGASNWVDARLAGHLERHCHRPAWSATQRLAAQCLASQARLPAQAQASSRAWVLPLAPARCWALAPALAQALACPAQPSQVRLPRLQVKPAYLLQERLPVQAAGGHLPDNMHTSGGKFLRLCSSDPHAAITAFHPVHLLPVRHSCRPDRGQAAPALTAWGHSAAGGHGSGAAGPGGGCGGSRCAGSTALTSGMSVSGCLDPGSSGSGEPAHQQLRQTGRPRAGDICTRPLPSHSAQHASRVAGPSGCTSPGGYRPKVQHDRKNLHQRCTS